MRKKLLSIFDFNCLLVISASGKLRGSFAEDEELNCLNARCSIVASFGMYRTFKAYLISKFYNSVIAIANLIDEVGKTFC